MTLLHEFPLNKSVGNERSIHNKKLCKSKVKGTWDSKPLPVLNKYIAVILGDISMIVKLANAPAGFGIKSL